MSEKSGFCIVSNQKNENNNLVLVEMSKNITVLLKRSLEMNVLQSPRYNFVIEQNIKSQHYITFQNLQKHDSMSPLPDKLRIFN